MVGGAGGEEGGERKILKVKTNVIMVICLRGLNRKGRKLVEKIEKQSSEFYNSRARGKIMNKQRKERSV